MRDTKLLSGFSQQVLLMIDAVALRSGVSCHCGVHQSDLVIIKKSVEVQYAFSLMRERDCLSVEEAHCCMLSM
ncbi:hypothetical protein ACRAQ6_00750 [Erythrobacter sp. HA6-11]